MNKPLVSICIPVFNGAAFLAETLATIIAQTYPNLEIIVSDNGSTDATPDIIKKFQKIDARIQHLRREDTVIYAANCNLVIKAATGKYIALYHADDLYHPDIVTEQIKFFELYPELGCVFCLGQAVDQNNKLLPTKKHFTRMGQKIDQDVIVDLATYVRNLCFVGNQFICPSSMMRADVYAEIGYFNEKIKMVEDLDICSRVLRKHKIAVIGQELIKYRIHEQQGSQLYRTNSRKHLAEDVVFLNEYIANNPEFADCEAQMQKRTAFDYLKLAIYAAERSDFSYYKKMLAASKLHYSYPITKPAQFALQHLPHRLGYFLARLIR